MAAKSIVLLIFWGILGSRLVLALAPTPWAVPKYPPTTIDNDGTHATRYDVRKTLAYVTDSAANINNVFMLYNLVTETGRKYHITSNLGLIGNATAGTFVSLNDLQDMSGRGASTRVPGTGNPDRLQIVSQAQNITAPLGGDQWTGTRMTLDLAGIGLDLTVRPTGGNFYYGGGGGINLFQKTPDTSYHKSVPGWSWYWANPTTRVNGTVTIDNVRHQIDPSKSFALFERQWGDFGVGKGYFALWFYLETGEVLISWVMEPDQEGKGQVAFASIWHPNGLHEMVPVGPKSRAWDISVSNTTGLKYFNKFFLDLPARKASFSFGKWVRDAEIVEDPPEQFGRYITISESYGEGTAMWNGRRVRFHGHVEQLSRNIAQGSTS